MKCRECPDYAKCVKESNLAIKRKNCPKAKTEKVKTNADRIRAMSDEELAEEFHAIMLGWNEWCDYHCENRGDDGCDKCILKWLKQPADATYNADRCVSCGEIIPEGRQVCPNCEGKQ